MSSSPRAQECWYSWRHYLEAFSRTHRVVAVDMRGYGETAHADSSWWTASDYAMEHLVADVHALIRAFGRTEVTLVAHDWGGLVAWSFATAHSAMVSRLVIMNVPHPAAYQASMTLTQLLRSWYIFVFQLPGIGELWGNFDDFATMRAALYSRATGIRNRDEPHALSSEEVDAVYKWSFSRAGTVAAAVNYYRNVFGANAAYQRRIGMRRSNPLPMPVLIVWGTEDAALGKGLASASAAYCRDARVEMIEGASHWVQQDAVATTMTTVARWLGVETHPLSSRAVGGASSASTGAGVVATAATAAAAPGARDGGSGDSGGGASAHRE